jgi:hypothetical protein
MTPDQERLVLGLVIGQGGVSPLSKEEFLGRWPAQDGVELGLALLGNAIVERSSDDVEYALVVCFRFGITLDHLPLLDALSRVDWHFRHEDVAQALKDVGTEAAIPPLIMLLSARPPYLDELDEAVALARHALHGLERIGGSQARQVIEASVSDPRERVSANAQRMLRRM